MLKYNRGDVMNILICDDNTAFAMQLQKDINEYFHNPNMITNMITDHFDQIEGTYDVIFMDIELMIRTVLKSQNIIKTSITVWLYSHQVTRILYLIHFRLSLFNS